MFKHAGFKLDTQYNRTRLSEGSTVKDYWSDFALCEHHRPDPELISLRWRASNRFERSGLAVNENSTSCARLSLK